MVDMGAEIPQGEGLQSRRGFFGRGRKSSDHPANALPVDGAEARSIEDTSKHPAPVERPSSKDVETPLPKFKLTETIRSPDIVSTAVVGTCRAYGDSTIVLASQRGSPELYIVDKQGRIVNSVEDHQLHNLFRAKPYFENARLIVNEQEGLIIIHYAYRDEYTTLFQTKNEKGIDIPYRNWERTDYTSLEVLPSNVRQEVEKLRGRYMKTMETKNGFDVSLSDEELNIKTHDRQHLVFTDRVSSIGNSAVCEDPRNAGVIYFCKY